MINEDENLDRRRISKEQNKRTREDVRNSSSKLGYLIIFSCVLIVSVGMLVTQRIDAKALPKPKDTPVDTINLSSLSTSWTCPVSGESKKGDALLLANPDQTRTSHIDISTFDLAGKELSKKSYEVAPASQMEIEVAEVLADESTSLFVESFSSSIAVFRSLSFSDGRELVSCLNNLDSRADFPNLQTIRNSNSTIIIANPFGEAIVIDLTANLLDSSVTPPIATIDEVRGIIVPAHGKMAIDLQAEFGRYPLVSAHLKSRSGFFAAEAIVTFKGAESVTGQTIVSSAYDFSHKGSITWVGAAPTRIAAFSESLNSHSVEVAAIATDKRAINGEAQILTPGTTSILNNVGADFANRTTVISINDGANQPSNIFASWLHASGQSVSGGSFAVQKSKRSIVPVGSEDNLQVYNPNNEKVTFTVTKLGSKAEQKFTIDALSYRVFPLQEFEIKTISVIEINAKKKIIIAAGDSTFASHSPGIEVRS